MCKLENFLMCDGSCTTCSGRGCSAASTVIPAVFVLSCTYHDSNLDNLPTPSLFCFLFTVCTETLSQLHTLPDFLHPPPPHNSSCHTFQYGAIIQKFDISMEDNVHCKYDFLLLFGFVLKPSLVLTLLVLESRWLLSSLPVKQLEVSIPESLIEDIHLTSK